MNTLTGVELDAAVASVLGKDYPLIQQCERVRAFNPSHSRALAMQLLIDLEMGVIRSLYQSADLKWVAGWDHFDYDGEMRYQAEGETPQVAICRAIVQRAEDQARDAERLAAEQAERDRREAIRAVAWDRANQARATRTSWTEFANDEERAAYALALDQQLENIRARNAVDGAEPATGLLSFVARPS